MTAHARIGVGEVRLSATARRYVNDALDSNRLSYGKYSRRFESEFARIHSRRFACFLNSGTSALHVGLAALKEQYGWKDGAEVLVPAVTFVASLNVVLHNNLTPVLVDIRLSDYGMGPEQVSGILGRREASGEPLPVAVMPVHLFGRPSSPNIQWLARSLGVKVITDSCETMFVEGCAEGDVSCFSTYTCHVINTGVGGFATTDDPDLAALIRSYANHGRNGIYTGIDDALGVRETMDARFTFDRPGFSYRATELEAAIGCAALETWGDEFVAREERTADLVMALSDLPLALPRVGGSAHMMLPILAEDGVRDDLCEHLEQCGIETRQMLPLTNQPYLKRLMGDDLEDRFPVAKMVNERGFYVASHAYLTKADIKRMSDAFHEFYQ